MTDEQRDSVLIKLGWRTGREALLDEILQMLNNNYDGMAQTVKYPDYDAYLNGYADAIDNIEEKFKEQMDDNR